MTYFLRDFLKFIFPVEVVFGVVVVAFRLFLQKDFDVRKSIFSSVSKRK